MEKINSSHIRAYFQCITKSYLLYHKHQEYEPTDYENMSSEFKEIEIRKYYNNKSSSHAQAYKDGILKKGYGEVFNVRIDLNDFFYESELLLKVVGKSVLGEFHYVPVIFVARKDISSESRHQLTFLALLLEMIQKRFPAVGNIITNDGLKHKIQLGRLKNNVKKAIAIIQSFSTNPPKLLLNKHCEQCGFKNSCKRAAINEDSLSLLDRITAKQILLLEKKGIFTINQLSYIFKQKRKSKRIQNLPVRYRPELQALAIRTRKTYVQEMPSFERKQVEIFLDIEGLDNHFYYLFGVLINESEKQTYKSIWSDAQKDEETSWKELIRTLKYYEDAPIYHYGSFECSALSKLSKKYKSDIEDIRFRLVNVNSFIYGKIYFPAYSNRLKELGRAIGIQWTNEKASGLQSIVWRNRWESGGEEFKNDLLIYNREDCSALLLLTNEITRIQKDSLISSEIDFVAKPKKISNEISDGIHNQFELLFEQSHSNYDKKKIKINLTQNKIIKQDNKQKNNKKGYWWLGKSLPKPSRTFFFPADKTCYKHPEQNLTKSKITSKRVVVDLVFHKNGIRKTITEYVGTHGVCTICNNSYPPIGIRVLSRQLYGRNYMAWYVYQRIEIQLSFSKINSTLYEMLKDKVASATGGQFVKFFSEYYAETEDKIIQQIMLSPFIHADETVVSISGENQYVWIFTTGAYVIFKLSKSREAITPVNFLKGFKGVLISDFFSGYDKIECKQQKCWVHLIRDLNNDLWNHPFDKEFENLVLKIRNLIIPIIQTADERGLKRYYLRKYEKVVIEFYKCNIDKKSYKSENCILYQKRLLRYRDSLFTFIQSDGISWHNNAAENGIRHICVQRKISGSFGSKTFPEHLRMVAIMQTCKLQHKSFLKFLLSRERDIDKF